MKYDVVTECTCCNDTTLCREEVTEIDGTQQVLHFCEFCDKEIQDILDEYNNELEEMNKMIFYEFNDFGYYALIGSHTMDDALKEYENTVADIEEKELTPDILTVDEARKKYCRCLVEQEEGNKTYEEFEKEFNELKESKKVQVFLIDGSLL